MTLFSENVITIIQSIPEGKVMSYGQIAAYAGSPRGARQVARLLHSSSKKYQLPWQRVIGSSGKISLSADRGGDLQRELLIEEGVILNARGSIDFDIFGWEPMF